MKTHSMTQNDKNYQNSLFFGWQYAG